MDIPIGNNAAELIYKRTPSRNLKLTFLPPKKIRYDKAPVYFLIPGGGWHVEDRQSMIDFSLHSVEALRNEGFAVVSIDYRVYKEGVVMREIIADCFDAARYVSHFAETLKIDKDSFITSGHSAGAHLALMLSYAPNEDFQDNYVFTDTFKVKVAAVMSPPTMLHDPSTNSLRDLDDLFIGEQNGEKERTSPITYVTTYSPPTLLIAGTCDYLVFATSAEKLYQKLFDCGVKSKLLLARGAGHSFEKIYDSIEPSITMQDVQEEIIRFVLAHMQ
jgi:acetyl esterase/lipase